MRVLHESCHATKQSATSEFAPSKESNLLFKFSNYKIDKDWDECNEGAIAEHDVESSTCFFHASSSWFHYATTSTDDENFHDDDDDCRNERDADYEHCCYDDKCFEFHKNNDDDHSIAALPRVVIWKMFLPKMLLLAINLCRASRLMLIKRRLMPNDENCMTFFAWLSAVHVRNDKNDLCDE